MKTLSIWMLPISAVVLTGCATPGYECKKPLACAPVHGNYQKSVTDNSWDGWQAGGPIDTTPYGQADHADQTPETLKVTMSPRANVPMVSGEDATSGPVYAPPRPWRVWLAPYSRADGTLESGTYIWFTTPGHWTYLGRQWIAPPFAGPHEASGDDDGPLGPVVPSDLGFTPGKSVAPQGVLSNIAQPNADGGSN